jgi:hypothetical protein
MSQNDLVIDNQNFPATRADINSALQALGSLNSGSSAPSTTYANMLWYDTATNTLKMRAEANDQWISIGYLDQTADAFRIFDDTQVVNSSGTQTGLIGDQATSAWQAGTSTTESLVSPAKVKSAVEALVPAPTMEVIAAAKMQAVNVNPPTTYFSTGFASIVRQGTGQYRFTFTTPRSSVDYVVSGLSQSTTSRTPATNSFDVNGFDVDVQVISSGGYTDQPFDIVVHALPS